MTLHAYSAKIGRVYHGFVRPVVEDPMLPPGGALPVASCRHAHRSPEAAKACAFRQLRALA